jgi:adenylate cyclase
MSAITKHWPRIAITLLPVLLALAHAFGVVTIGVLPRLDSILYDAWLRTNAPQTLDERIVIVDIDEKSLAELGRWPWSRNTLAQLVDVLFEEQQVAVLGIDMYFVEPDQSSGLQRLQALAEQEFKDTPGFAEKLRQLKPALDYDAVFAKAIGNRAVVLGHYMTADRGGHKAGKLPAPVIRAEASVGLENHAEKWDGYGANLAAIAKMAPVSGQINFVAEEDGVVRSLPIVANFEGNYYEALSLAIFRTYLGFPTVGFGKAEGRVFSKKLKKVDRLVLSLPEDRTMDIPVDDHLTALIPYRGDGGPDGGSFEYVSASDVLAKRFPAGYLKDKIVLLGTTAPGLNDLRTTPVGDAYPGVEIHANMISALLDGKTLVQSDYDLGYEVGMILLAGLTLAFALPLLSAPKAVGLSVGVFGALVGTNYGLYSSMGWVLPLATPLAMAFAAFALNMSYGYFVESRSKRELAHIFGTYVPPELVVEMLKDPDSYSMKATSRELTVMFCDMRGFTTMSEQMEPLQLQALLTGVFSRLTSVIRGNKGTIDKYMGDCVMAFWGAPVESARHAHLAVKSAMEMANGVREINLEHRQKGLPEIGIGIGLNTGFMCVGDMGSNIRRSYTVIGDAVNLGSRLEGLSKHYGVDIVVNESTRKLATDFAWQELDRVRVKGKEQAVTIYWPMAPLDRLTPEASQELKTWKVFLNAYRAQDAVLAENVLTQLLQMNPKKYLYLHYAERVAAMRLRPFDLQWDGATNFETK